MCWKKRNPCGVVVAQREWVSSRATFRSFEGRQQLRPIQVSLTLARPHTLLRRSQGSVAACLPTHGHYTATSWDLTSRWALHVAAALVATFDRFVRRGVASHWIFDKPPSSLHPTFLAVVFMPLHCHPSCREWVVAMW